MPPLSPLSLRYLLQIPWLLTSASAQVKETTWRKEASQVSSSDPDERNNPHSPRWCLELAEPPKGRQQGSRDTENLFKQGGATSCRRSSKRSGSQSSGGYGRGKRKPPTPKQQQLGNLFISVPAQPTRVEWPNDMETNASKCVSLKAWDVGPNRKLQFGFGCSKQPGNLTLRPSIASVWGLRLILCDLPRAGAA